MAVSGAVLGGSTDLLFLVADAYYAGEERWLPVAWAVPQGIVGLINMGVSLPIFVDAPRRGDGFGWSMAVGLSAVGTWFVIHTIVSLVEGSEAPSRSSGALSFDVF